VATHRNSTKSKIGALIRQIGSTHYIRSVIHQEAESPPRQGPQAKAISSLS